MAMILTRPSWLPDGHAFCPGTHEEVRLKIEQSGFVTEVLTCEHGQWMNKADAWTAHDQFKPEGVITVDESIERIRVIDDGEVITNVPPSTKPAIIPTFPMPERANRAGDSQELPVVNDQPYVQHALIQDIKDRIDLGIRRYGTGLQINNGRDMLQDALEEAIDLAVYLKGAIMERDAARD